MRVPADWVGVSAQREPAGSTVAIERGRAHTPVPALLSDAEVMMRSRVNPEWFAEVYQRHHAVIHRFLRRRVATDTADDIAAETFARAFAAVDRYSPRFVSARPWLFGIAANVLRQHFRSGRRAQSAYAVLAGLVPPEADPSTTAVERVDAERDAKPFQRHVAALPEREQIVLRMRADHHLTYAEIAEALGIPIGTVRSRLARARVHVKNQDGHHGPAVGSRH